MNQSDRSYPYFFPSLRGIPFLSPDRAGTTALAFEFAISLKLAERLTDQALADVCTVSDRSFYLTLDFRRQIPEAERASAGNRLDRAPVPQDYDKNQDR
jgi:hypothetical protein